MFSAIYLVCMVGQPCMFFVDNMPYPTEKVCVQAAEDQILNNKNRVLSGEIPDFTVEYQCISWEEA